jgi:hypothetical protein
MMREYPVRICEGLGAKFPGPTRQKPKYPLRADASAFHPTSDIRRDQRQTNPASSTTAFTVTGFGKKRDPDRLARSPRRHI